jgi:hypothetical protein
MFVIKAMVGWVELTGMDRMYEVSNPASHKVFGNTKKIQ